MSKEWIWFGEDDAGREHVSFARWQSHPCQLRYKLAEVQPTEHDHPADALEGGVTHRHLCGYPDYGTYEGQVILVAPDFLKEKWPTGIGIDVCLALEIQKLWQAGIQTTGHCCDHGGDMPYIGVIPEHIERMKGMGYKVQPNPSRPGDEDSFVPKTRLSALSAPAQRVEEGWKMVPVEPTETMLDAYWEQTGESREMRSRTHAYMRRYYAVMLAASPPPAPNAGVEESSLREKAVEAFFSSNRSAGFQEAIDAVIAVCMEEAAKVADRKADEENRGWLDSAMSNEDAWVRGGMATEIAAAIRSLIPTSEAE